MNTFGNLGGLLCPLVVGWAVERQHSWTLPFYITAAVYTAGAIAWLAIDPQRPIGAVPAQSLKGSRNVGCSHALKANRQPPTVAEACAKCDVLSGAERDRRGSLSFSAVGASRILHKL
jgi:hypothetical protein